MGCSRSHRKRAADRVTEPCNHLRTIYTYLHEALRRGRAVAAACHGERDGRSCRQRRAADAQRGVQRAGAVAARTGAADRVALNTSHTGVLFSKK